ncbi:hypothetical protein SAY86_015580 [Trapa natans]|uniref:Uncharacterized protein n=1 Tax=Trapa natans TaxID=22666 RepID=A0AAN7LEE0_TRANT|nr:hypothetical protein SAY86_015580 [Trapa natans]
MEENGGAASGRVTGIRLKEIFQKWQAARLTPKPDGGSTSHLSSAVASGGIPRVVIDRRLQDQVRFCWDSDEDSLQSPVTRPSPDVPKGYLAMYVDEELRRFVILTGYVRHPLFKVLLEKAEEEFGFDHTGGLTIPCEIETFKYLLECMENHRRRMMLVPLKTRATHISYVITGVEKHVPN